MGATFRGRVLIAAGTVTIPGRADLTCHDDAADHSVSWQGDITVDQPDAFDGIADPVQISIGRRTALATVAGAVPGCDGHTLRVYGIGDPPF